jgi:group I intron endonuclease
MRKQCGEENPKSQFESGRFNQDKNLMGYIYIIRNKINDKVYIGKTDLDINKRFKEHIKDSRRRRCEKRPLYSAMRKYGCEHFYVELIEET